jgi:hypothetical protein
MAAQGFIADVQVLTYAPGGAGTPVDLACYVTEPPADEVDFETIDQPTLCNPQQSMVKVGARTLTMTLLWTDDWAEVIDPLFGTTGTLVWGPAGPDEDAYTYEVSWPATHGLSAAFGESVIVEVSLGVNSRALTPAA